ncbi:DsrE family protein [Diaphorobacter sp.]|uniref:DsrE family protein n=1 Tax=Diaphorobacter sp. TaxID=1934310 RepID=UPI0028AAD8C8|nr:DsrE family protein [Diaphorobacter sp.]
MLKPADFVATVFDGKSNPNKVTVTFTMALNAVQKGHSAMVMLMVEAVELGVPGATNAMDIGQPFEPVTTLLESYLAKGGRVGVCKSCMLHNGLTAEQMDPRYEIITAPDVIDFLMQAKGSLQIT